MNTSNQPSPPAGPIRLHIERLVLDGLPLTPAEAGRFRLALEDELSRRLARANAASWSSTAIASLSGSPAAFAHGRPPARFASEVASSLMGSLFNTQNAASTRTPSSSAAPPPAASD